MAKFKPILNPFSKYVDKLERKADWILSWLSFYGHFSLQKHLLNLMQENLVVLNLWIEKCFKGYRNLRKGNRRKVYANAAAIGKEFKEYVTEKQINEERLAEIIERNEEDLGPENWKKLVLLAKIISFMSEPGRYQYLEGASFSKMLLDGKRMIGDCNQVVTWYVFLYSLYFPITDLQIRLPTGHVCLNFTGIDIEATNGTFQRYSEGDILPIVELLTTNLLDVSDFRDKQNKIPAKEFLRGAKLANQISSHRDLVSKNLSVAYHNVGIEYLQAKDYDNAEFFLEFSGDREALQTVWHNAVLTEVENKNFAKARFWQSKSGDQELRKYIAAQEYNHYLPQISGFNSLDQYRTKKTVIQKLITLAKEMQDYNIQQGLEDIYRKI